MELHLRRVRCFVAPTPIPIRPLTILVGENSTGKSSFLALFRTAYEVAAGNLAPSFNKEPFFLGAFDQLAHVRGGAQGRAKTFEIGLCINLPSERDTALPDSPATATAHFTKVGSQAAIYRFDVTIEDTTVSIFLEDERSRLEIQSPIWSGDVGANPVIQLLRQNAFSAGFDISNLLLILGVLAQNSPENLLEDKRVPADARDGVIAAFKKFSKALEAFRAQTRQGAYAIAPVRTKPERTYNPVEYTPQAEGAHVPMVIAKAKFQGKREWDRIRDAIESFGKEAGLFDAFNVKTLGKSDGDPFQLEVKTGGRLRNIIDVGYGVSQVLPIIVDLTSEEQNRTYLLQQPEVHLHPRGQAALGSFFCEVTQKIGTRVLVETHSDYLIDRIRAEVRDKRLQNPQSVVILYFERVGSSTQIHQIEIDKDGNLVNEPPSYREFFLKEVSRTLGI